MLLNFGTIVNAALAVLGIVWCREMFGRWRKDVDEFRAARRTEDRAVILFLWALTLLIGLFVLASVVGIGRTIFNGFGVT